MRPVNPPSKLAARAAAGLIILATLVVGACDNDVNFNPVLPTVSTVEPTRSLQIRGDLVAVGGACFVATVLYDGRELPGARSVCPSETGCERMALAGRVETGTGRHAISFLIVSQDSEFVEYLTGGSVTVTRPGINMATTIGLDPQRARLRAGDSVSFDVEFWNIPN